MNRRAFLRGAITVGVVAAIAKGRLLDTDEPVIMGVDVGKPGGDHTVIVMGNPQGNGHHAFYQRLIEEEVHVHDRKVIRFNEAVWGEAA